MFSHLKSAVQRRFSQLILGPLFYVEVDKDKIWQIYLDSFTDPAQRQGNTCNCCKSFLRQFAGIVGISDDNRIMTLWDIPVGDPARSDLEYGPAITALRNYVRSLPIVGPFYHTQNRCGTDKTPDPAKGLVWEHFAIDLPDAAVKPVEKIGKAEGDLRDNASGLMRGIHDITPDAIATVLELIEQGSLYRGAEAKGALDSFWGLHQQGRELYALSDPRVLTNFCWRVAASGASGAVLRMRTTALGTLLEHLSEGKDLDWAVKSYETKMDARNYKRPTSLATPRMIEAAKQRLQDLGLMGALKRRLLNPEDLSVANALHVHRPTVKADDVFEELKKSTPVNPKSFDRVEEISIKDFIAKVLPTATSVKLLVENHHLSNFAALVGAQDPSQPTMFYWGNNFSWAYTGDVTDSIKDRVKAAGGNVTGKLRVSLSWGNEDDLDLHVHGPGGLGVAGDHIYFRNKRGSSGGELDVDMNAHDITPDPVENITWQHDPRHLGVYVVVVNQFRKRPGIDSGFTVEIEYDGQVTTFNCPRNGRTGEDHEIARFKVDHAGVHLLTEGTVGNYRSQTKWGITTGAFHQVRAITLSPNHWSPQGRGNTHVFFLLEGCKTDERIRGFYPEFLTEALAVDRKTFEMLGAKVEVATAADELSGLGFSETQRSHALVEVESAFKRVLKIKF